MKKQNNPQHQRAECGIVFLQTTQQSRTQYIIEKHHITQYSIIQQARIRKCISMCYSMIPKNKMQHTNILYVEMVSCKLNDLIYCDIRSNIA